MTLGRSFQMLTDFLLRKVFPNVKCKINFYLFNPLGSEDPVHPAQIK